MKKFKRILIVTITMLLITLLCYGCSANFAPDKGGNPESGWDGVAPPNQDIAPGEPYPSYPSGPLPDKVERKFIQNGVLALRSSDIQKTFESLSSLAINSGGRVVSYEQLSEGDIKWITMRVTVPYGKLSEFMEHTAENVTKVENKTVKSEEVTEAYYDTETRIKSTEELIAHYRSMLTKAETIEDTLLVQTRIDELTVELESSKGYLQLLENLTQESRIDITIRMETDPTITKPEVTWKTLKWSDVGYLMKNGIQKVGIGIVLFFQYFLVFLVYASPIIVLLVIVLVILLLLRKKRRKRNAAKTSHTGLAPPAEYVHPDERSVGPPEGE